MTWIWQQLEWPKFTYNYSDLADKAYLYAKNLASIVGPFEKYSDTLKQDIMLDIIVAESQKTSAIEGEIIQPDGIRSSLEIQLGLSEATSKTNLDKRAEGIATMMLKSREEYNYPLSEQMLFDWHELLMHGINPYLAMVIGYWRTDSSPMQIVSGPLGKQKVHYEAPPSRNVAKEMKTFIKWFNKSGKEKIPGPIRAAIAHLYFECIHPFQDGNGRIGRAIAEKALSQDLNSPILFSISTSIDNNKDAYYKELAKASKGDLDITSWINYFLDLLLKAQEDAKDIVEYTIKKAFFWQKYKEQINQRQNRLLERMFKEGLKGFEGGISSSKYTKLLDVSKATATRDLTDMYYKGCLKKLPGKGKNTRYDINL